MLTFTIVGGEANPFTRDIHDRMPIIIEPHDRQRWLHDPDPADLLRPARMEILKRYPVSTAVNSSRSNSEALIEPIGLTET